MGTGQTKQIARQNSSFQEVVEHKAYIKNNNISILDYSIN